MPSPPLFPQPSLEFLVPCITPQQVIDRIVAHPGQKARPLLVPGFVRPKGPIEIAHAAEHPTLENG